MPPAPNDNGSSNGDADLSVLLGGVPMTAHFKDGTTEEVRVVEVDIDSMLTLLAVIKETRPRVDLYCGKPKGWSEKLTTKSLIELLEKGKELNDPLFDAWYRDRLQTTELLTPGFQKRLEDSVAQSASEFALQAVASALESSATPSLTA